MYNTVAGPSPMNRSQMSKEEKEWRAKDDLHTLIEAEKIKKDKPRLKAAMEKKREMAKNLAAIDD